MNKQLLIVALAIVLTLLSGMAGAAERTASIVVDAKTGRVLGADNAESLRHPASITKIMTLYLTFKAIKQGTLRSNQGLKVSAFAAAQSPSKLGLKPGGVLRVRDAILGLVVQSANDAAVVLAEGIGGSEEHFAKLMTQQARALGMTRTVFRNASGLPNDGQVTTARDMAILARAMIFNFPEYYRLFSTRNFAYRGVEHDNHNHLMERYAGMDGIKTGYIRASGFNLVASAMRGKTRLIAVIFGGTSARSRDNDMAALLDDGFARANIMEIAEARRRQAETIIARREGAAPPVTQPAAEPSADVAAAKAAAAMMPEGAGDFSDEAAAENGQTAAPRASAPQQAASPAVASFGGPAAPGSWAVQVGAYSSRASASQALEKIGQYLPKTLAAAKYQVIEVASESGMLFRVRLVGLGEDEARDICRSLARQDSVCALIPPA